MRELTLFVMRGCPHCKMALQYTEELCNEDPRLRQVPVRQIDETEQPELADQYDYYYVPCYFLGEQKLHQRADPQGAAHRAGGIDKKYAKWEKKFLLCGETVLKYTVFFARIMKYQFYRF